MTDSCHDAACAKSISGLQALTLAWMIAECAVSLWSAARAHSPALLAFGADSLVELFSAAVVLLQFVPLFALRPVRAARLAGVLLYVLAVVVTGVAVMALVTQRHAETSLPGMAITLAALLVMPLLAWQKRRVARKSGNVALAADAVQSATCAYLAAVTLAGLAVNAVWHVGWVDSAAALVAVPLILLEARRAMRGESCGCGVC
uniref:Cation transporter n=1 Tax=Acidobacterium capsulatum TaxID=33075 RepID=A0A7V4XQT1_9BACT